MDSTRYQIELKDLLLLPLVGLAAPGVNSSLNYLLVDLERLWLDFCFDFVDATRSSGLPGPIIDLLEMLAIRSVAWVAVATVAIALVSVGRRTRSAALCLVATMPFSPQIGFDSFSFYFRAHQWLSGWPELALTLSLLFILMAFALRVPERCGDRVQQLVLAGFCLVGALGWWKLNPWSYGPQIPMG